MQRLQSWQETQAMVRYSEDIYLGEMWVFVDSHRVLQQGLTGASWYNGKQPPEEATQQQNTP